MFQSPKGRLQTELIQGKRIVDLQFQSPKGRLQTRVCNNPWKQNPLFQSPKGRLQTDKELVDLIYEFKSFNPQRGGYKRKENIGKFEEWYRFQSPKGRLQTLIKRLRG